MRRRSVDVVPSFLLQKIHPSRDGFWIIHPSTAARALGLRSVTCWKRRVSRCCATAHPSHPTCDSGCWLSGGGRFVTQRLRLRRSAQVQQHVGPERRRQTTAASDSTTGWKFHAVTAPRWFQPCADGTRVEVSAGFIEVEGKLWLPSSAAERHSPLSLATMCGSSG